MGAKRGLESNSVSGVGLPRPGPTGIFHSPQISMPLGNRDGGLLNLAIYRGNQTEKIKYCELSRRREISFPSPLVLPYHALLMI